MNRMSLLAVPLLCASLAGAEEDDFDLRPLDGKTPVVSAPRAAPEIETGEGEAGAEEDLPAATTEWTEPAPKKPAPVLREPVPARNAPALRRAGRAAAPQVPTAAAPGLAARAKIELDFLHQAYAGTGSEVLASLERQLDDWLNAHRDQPGANRAQMLRARVREDRRNYVPAALDYLNVLYEYPDAKTTLPAKSRVGQLARKRLKKRKVEILNIANGPSEGLSRPERLVALLRRLAELDYKPLHAPMIPELHSFLRRYPDHRMAGEMMLLLARVHDRAKEPRTAVMLAERVLAAYTAPALRAEAQSAIGDFYAESLKDYNKAMDAYQVVVDRYGDSEEAGDSYVKMARILDKNLKQPKLAVEILDQLVAKYPKTDAAHDALKDQSRIFKSRLKDYGRAVESLETLAGMFEDERAAEALGEAAGIAGGAKDYARQVKLWETLVERFPEDEQAPKALWDAGQVYERRLGDAPAAVTTYQKLVAKYPTGKLAKRAGKRIEALEE